YYAFVDIINRSVQSPQLTAHFTLEVDIGSYATWASLTFLSMAAIMFLPRQFQVTVVENVDERHLTKAIWLFPLYLLAINIFVLPITFGGLLRFPDGTLDVRTCVLTLPRRERRAWLAVVPSLVGESAAAGM